MFNAIDTRRLVKVDFVVRKDEPYRRKEFNRRQQVRIDDLNVWLVTVEDLVLSKLMWARESGSAIQLADVRALIARGPSLDWSYLERWAASLGVNAVLQECRNA